MYIDWVGDQPELLTDPATGEMTQSSCVCYDTWLQQPCYTARSIPLTRSCQVLLARRCPRTGILWGCSEVSCSRQHVM